MFRVELEQLVDAGHPLVKLGQQMDWAGFEERLGATYAPTPSAWLPESMKTPPAEGPLSAGLGAQPVAGELSTSMDSAQLLQLVAPPHE